MLETALESGRENMAENDVPAGQQAQAIASLEGHFRGVLANLDAEIKAIEERLLTERAEHDAQEHHFCSTENVGYRLVDRIGKDPADAQNALHTGIQCRTAYRGAVSRPSIEALDNLRELCFIARDRIVNHHDNPEIVYDPDTAALYAVARCADYRGAAWVAYELTGADWTTWHDAEMIVLELRTSMLRGEFSRR